MNITLSEVRKLAADKLCYVDIRSAIAYQHGHLPNAVNLEDGLLTDLEEKLPKEKKLVVYCSIGEKSKEAVEQLNCLGYQALNLIGGYQAWLLEEYNGLSEPELSRYERQIILPEVGTEGQKRLKKAKVLIIGAGGLGSPAALYLAAAGIGKIGIADADVVSLSNLQRQILHSMENVGVNKAVSAKEGIEKINDETEVIVYPYFATAQNIATMIEQYDFIIDAADNFETKFLINDACVLAKKPFCHAGIIRFQGQVMTYVPGEYPCYRCIFENIPEAGSIPNCSQAGIIGAVSGIVGSIQALEAIKYILIQGELLVGKMLLIDGLTMQFRIVDFLHKSPACRVCGEKKDIFNVCVNAEEYSRNFCQTNSLNEGGSL